MNSGAMKIGDRFIRFNSEEGTSDLLACIPHPIRGGVFCALETKRPGWRPARSGKVWQKEQRQRAFLDRVVKAGGLGMFVDGIDKLREYLRREGFEV